MAGGAAPAWHGRRAALAADVVLPLLTVLLLFETPPAAGDAMLSLAKPGGGRGRVHLEEGVDFWPFPFGATGAVEGRLLALGKFGCGAAASADGHTGPPSLLSPGVGTPDAPRVGIVSRGHCKFQDKIDYAASLGMAALLIYNQGDAPLRKGLIVPHINDNKGLPVLFLTYDAGVSLVGKAYDHGNISLAVQHDYACPRFDTAQVTPETSQFARHEYWGDEALNLTTSQRTSLANAGSPDQILLLAAQLGHTALAKWALNNNASIDHTARERGGALHIAAWYEQIGIITDLLRMGADIDLPDDHQRTPLAVAVLSDRNAAKVLLENGADVDKVDKHGYPPLYNACRTHAALCNLLLQFGADPNFQPRATGMSVVHDAVARDDVEVVGTLLRDPRVDFSRPDRQNRTPADWAESAEMRALLRRAVNGLPADDADGAPALRVGSALYRRVELPSAFVIAFLVFVTARGGALLRGLAGFALFHHVINDDGAPFPAALLFAVLVFGIITRPGMWLVKLAFTFALLTDVW